MRWYGDGNHEFGLVLDHPLESAPAETLRCRLGPLEGAGNCYAELLAWVRKKNWDGSGILRGE